MRKLSIDIEAYSPEPIEHGLYKYSAHPDFDILMIAYKLDDNPTLIIDLFETKTPTWFIEALQDPAYLKTAYNAPFEMRCLSVFFNIVLDPAQWRCTMTKASYAGLPFGLDKVSKVLNTVNKKDSKGKTLIKYFSVPCKPTKTNGQRTRNYPWHAPDKWQEFKDYCIQDVNTEVDIDKHTDWFPIADFEKPMWTLDQKINAYGVRADIQFAENVIHIRKTLEDRLKDRLHKLTKLANPNSLPQLKNWIKETTGLTVTSLAKDKIQSEMDRFRGTDVEEVLDIRQHLKYTSLSKFNSIVNCAVDEILYGMFRHNGANRTGRSSGQLVQFHNLKRNSFEGEELALARSIAARKDIDALELCYNNPLEVLSELIRPAFIPRKNCKLIACDYSAIEARVTAWLANEQWRLDVFNSHGLIYEASAALLYNVSIESIQPLNKDGFPQKDSKGEKLKGPNYGLRQKGKATELSLGFGGAVDALRRMGGEDIKQMPDKELLTLVVNWRRKSPNIVKFWNSLQRAAVTCIRTGRTVTLQFGITFKKINKNLILTLPSGRNLSYISVSVDRYVDNYGNTKDGISYYGIDQVKGTWSKQWSYGGKLCENIVQATARDLLFAAMLKLSKMGFNIPIHVHDEIVIEAKDDETLDSKLNLIKKVMTTPPAWAKGLPLGISQSKLDFYQK